MSIEQLQELQYRRLDAIRQVNKQTNAAAGNVRRALGWRYDSAEEGRLVLNKRALKIVAAAFAGKSQAAADREIAAAVADLLRVKALGVAPYAAFRHDVELQMKRTARALPVWEQFAKGVKGLGELGLAVIVAEAGDLALYPDDGRLRKRLGLAPFTKDGMTKACSTWKVPKWRQADPLTNEEWAAAGYKGSRRAEMFAVVAEPLFRAQTVAGGPYRAAYDHRRARTALAHPEWTKMHSHMDALRYMTQRVLRDLRRAWRDAEGTVLEEPKRPIDHCPSPQPIQFGQQP